MKKLFFRFVSIILVLIVAGIVSLNILSRTPRSEVPGLSALHLLPARGFSYALVFSRENLIKEFLDSDTLSEGFYRLSARYLLKSYYSTSYSMVLKNAIGKYVVYASYRDGSFMLITKPRFRLKLLRHFLRGDKKDYANFTIRKAGLLYYYFVEDYLVITPDLNLLKISCDIAKGKRKSSVYDNVGYIDNHDFTLITRVNKPLIVLDPLVFGLSKDRFSLKARPVSSVIFDAIKKDNMLDSLPVSNVFWGIKIPYLELYDAYVSHYPDDALNLAACLWDIGGSGFVWYDISNNFLISLDARVPEERLVSDIFAYLKLKEEVDGLVMDTLLDIYVFKDNNNNSRYFLKYFEGVDENKFVFTNSQMLLNAFDKATYQKEDGFMNFKGIPGYFLSDVPYLDSIVSWYIRSDSLLNTAWKLSIKEYRTDFYIKGRKYSFID